MVRRRIHLSGPATTQMQSNWMRPTGLRVGADFSETTRDCFGDFGFILDDPGVWTTRAVPEPAGLALLLTGLAIRRGLRTR